jgi:hypothetical protein
MTTPIGVIHQDTKKNQEALMETLLATVTQ